jgi:hypothetical protein
MAKRPKVKPSEIRARLHAEIAGENPPVETAKDDEKADIKREVNRVLTEEAPQKKAWADGGHEMPSER